MNSSPVTVESALPRRRTTFARGVDGTRKGTAGVGVRRQKTLVRPERQRSQRAPILRKATAAPPAARAGATTYRIGRQLPSPEALTAYTTPPPPSPEESNWWTYTSQSGLAREGERNVLVNERSAIIKTISASKGLKPALCPDDGSSATDAFLNQTDHTSIPYRDDVIVRGFLYDFQDVRNLLAQKSGIEMSADWHGMDLTQLFVSIPDACAGFGSAASQPCSVPSRYVNGAPLEPGPGQACPDWNALSSLKSKGRLFFLWDEVKANQAAPHTLVVYNGAVLNVTDYFGRTRFLNNSLSGRRLENGVGKDVTYPFTSTAEGKSAIQCLAQRYQVGFVDRQSNGCAAYQTIMIIMLIVVLGVVLCRFFMAITFHYLFSNPVRVSKYTPQHRAAAMRQQWNPYGTGTAVGSMRGSSDSFYGMPAVGRTSYGSAIRSHPRMSRSTVPQDMFTILLVTCYSEGEQGIRNTLESLAATDYPDENKLLFVIADGLIKGDDWKTRNKTTPEVLVDMIMQDPTLPEPEPRSYLAIADGNVDILQYAGHFAHEGRYVPIVVVVKCGPPTENTPSNAKPGNRGKRDSQLVLMNFLSRVMFDDRMTPLDHELYLRIQQVTGGVTADKYEVILMVDADTKVAPTSLRHMVDAMKNDERIMGLCGETRIANKRASWVSRIQVFEYYISHHLGKAFESIFGGVTCLPGCFCMYRIKAQKGPSTVPLLVNPDIVEEYSENIVDTLHKKNLLLLGEDRFLTTLMLRSFPKRKMVFVPQAICHTVVPEEFKVLLSQRRRWINSTIHNLLELVKLRDLCGIFCFSMQFVIALELLGTVVLPAAIVFLYILLFSAIAGNANSLPLIMLLFSLALPGVLIAITTRKFVYVGWMLIYILALPIWNFVLPVYAFWHFDDFSWGQTRKVEGEGSQGAHGGREGEYEIGSVQLRRFSEWEQERMGRGYVPGARKPLPQIPVEPEASFPGSPVLHPYPPPSVGSLPRGSYYPGSPVIYPIDYVQPSASYAQGPEMYPNPHTGPEYGDPMYGDPVYGGAPYATAADPRWSTDPYSYGYASYDPPSSPHIAPSTYQIEEVPPIANRLGAAPVEDRRSWYLDKHRNRKVSSMPPGTIQLKGWIPPEERVIHTEERVSEPEGNASHIMGNASHIMGNASNLAVPVVEIVAPTPTSDRTTPFHFPVPGEEDEGHDDGQRMPSDTAVDRDNDSRPSPLPQQQAENKPSPPKPKHRGPGIRAKSTLPPIVTDTDIAAVPGIASTVRRFWDSFGNGDDEGPASTSRSTKPRTTRLTTKRTPPRLPTKPSPPSPSIRTSRPKDPPLLTLSIEKTRAKDLIPRQSSELNSNSYSTLLPSFSFDIIPDTPPPQDTMDARSSTSFSFGESSIVSEDHERREDFFGPGVLGTLERRERERSGGLWKWR
ncbi:chitin synthase [Spizellomyces sp. 'palustris']|nr:chitin synthase [Spizellomyces sp. 'palustris']